MSEKLKPFTVTISDTETYEPMWIRLNFVQCNKRYRKARNELGQKEFKCGKCQNPFKMDEQIALVGMKHHVNMTMCEACAKEIKGES